MIIAGDKVIGKEPLLLGDCNVNYLVKEHNANFKANLNLHGFKQIIKKPTRATTTTQSLIDIIATNNPETIKTANVIPLSIGDHDMVGCVRKMNAMKFKPKVIVCRNYTNYDPRVLNDMLQLIDWSVVYNCSDVNAA